MPPKVSLVLHQNEGNPWHVPKGREGRFREARKVCHDLTDEDGGITNRERYDECMYRRGWRRSRWTDRFRINL